MKIQRPEYFWMKATIVIPYACELTSIDVKKYQQIRSMTQLCSLLGHGSCSTWNLHGSIDWSCSQFLDLHAWHHDWFWTCRSGLCGHHSAPPSRHHRLPKDAIIDGVLLNAVDEEIPIWNILEMYAKGPYLTCQLSDCFYSGNIQQRTWSRRRNQMVAHEIQRFILGLGCGAH
jgi:hypothetical protein